MRTRNVTLRTLSCICSMAVASTPQVDSTEVRDFAVELAANGVPSGLLVAYDELVQARARAYVKSTDAEQVAFKSAVKSRISAFNRKHNRFRATDHGGVVHVSSVDVPPDVAMVLEHQTVTSGASDMPALLVFTRLILPAITGKEPMGVAGGGDLRNPDCSVLQPVQIEAGATTPMEILDQIAKQVPGVTWLVTYRADAPSHDLNVGLMCGDGSFMRFDAY